MARFLSTLHRQLQTLAALAHGDVSRRVAVDKHSIGGLADFDGPDLPQSNALSGAPRPTSKTVQEAAGEATAYFVCDRENVVVDFVDDDGMAGPNGPARDRHGPKIDQVLAQRDAAGNVVWHRANHLGTIHDLVDSSGTIVNHVSYDSYANVISQTDPAVQTRYLLTGRELDTATGLYYYRRRYYDPQIVPYPVPTPGPQTDSGLRIGDEPGVLKGVRSMRNMDRVQILGTLGVRVCP